MFADPCRKSLNKNDWDQVLWARETEHPTQTLVFTKPLDTTTWSLCAFSQALLVNSLMWRIRGKDHERRNYFAARNNKAQGLDKLRPKSF